MPGLIYQCRPNTSGTNSQGYFDDEHSFAKAPGVFRIVVIGDSVAEGMGMEYERAFPRLLEQQLNQSAAGHYRFEVVTLALTGYTTSQELIVLKTEAFQYHPDLILWSYVLNDPAYPIYYEASGDLFLLYEPKVHLWHLACEGSLRLKEAIEAQGGPTEFHARLHYLRWNDVEKNVGGIGRVCSEHHVPAVFMIHPVFEQDKAVADSAPVSLQVQLEDLAHRSGLKPLDLRRAFGGRMTEEVVLNVEPWDPWHANELGHRLLAEFIGQWLVREKQIPLGN